MSIKVEMRESVATVQSFLEEWYAVEYLAPRKRCGFLTLCNGSLRKHIMSFGKSCKFTVGSSGSGLFRIWKKPQTLLTKMSLTNLIWCVCVCFGGGGGGVKGLIVTRNNLVVMWKVRRKMGIISWFPLGLRWFSRGGCWWFFCKWIFNLCQKEEEKVGGNPITTCECND